MRIAAIEYNIENTSLDIFVSGCKEHSCTGCFNSELWDFSVGEEYTEKTIYKIKGYISKFNSLISNIFIVGGEPLDQDIYALRHLLRECSLLGKKVWLFTHYSIEDVPNNIKIYCDYIKVGAYDKDKLTDNNIQYSVKLASSNQVIHSIKNST